MSGHPDPTDHIALPLAAQLAGIPARTLRNWIGGGKLAAIRGQRGYLVRMADIDRVRQLIGHGGQVAGGLAAPLSPGPDTAEPTAANAANDAAMMAADRRAEAMAFTQELLAPFIAELGQVREELGRVKAERDVAERLAAEATRRAERAEREREDLRRRAEALQERHDALRATTPSGPFAAPAATSGVEDASEAWEGPEPLWRRIVRALRGGG